MSRLVRIVTMKIAIKVAIKINISLYSLGYNSMSLLVEL